MERLYKNKGLVLEQCETEQQSYTQNSTFTGACGCVQERWLCGGAGVDRCADARGQAGGAGAGGGGPVRATVSRAPHTSSQSFRSGQRYYMCR